MGESSFPGSVGVDRVEVPGAISAGLEHYQSAIVGVAIVTHAPSQPAFAGAVEADQV
jgi:hypothetical protein